MIIVLVPVAVTLIVYGVSGLILDYKKSKIHAGLRKAIKRGRKKMKANSSLLRQASDSEVTRLMAENSAIRKNIRRWKSKIRLAE